MKKKSALIVAFTCLLPFLAHAQTDKDGWEIYGDWLVKKTSDEMDPIQHSILRTRFHRSNNTGSYKQPEDNSFIGFSIYNARIVDLYTTTQVPGKGYWPSCDFDSGSYRIGQAKAKYISTVENPGSCDLVSINGHTIRDFKAGQDAQLKLNYSKGRISLIGFSAAWKRALQLSK